MKDTIFINYRSLDQPFAALLVDWRLTERFGREHVFRDSQSIPPGSYFADRIDQALHRCRALIAIMGERWLSRGADGRRYIDDPRDYVRREIAVALQRNAWVIPVLVEDTPLPRASTLPADIAGLASRQYDHLRVRTAEDDVARLVSRLARLLDVRARPRSAESRPGRAGIGSINLGGPVDARHSVLGNVYYTK